MAGQKQYKRTFCKIYEPFMKQILEQLFASKTLSKEQAKSTFQHIAAGNVAEAHIVSFLTVFMMRSITVEELDGFREALLELCLRVDLSDFNTIDMCGTGGDGKNTFNISTTAMFVAAGAGLHIAKHGNYGVSSVSGSSNVLQELGHTFMSDVGALRRSLEESGVCFMHAPLFHPAMKAVAPVRAALGMRTFFNMLGPMVNPAFPPNQIVGVFSMELARLYSYIYQNTTKKYIILRSLDGYDEISLTGQFKLIGNTTELLAEPSTLGLERLRENDLAGGTTPKENAQIFLNVLEGNGTAAQNAVVCANAAVAIHCVKPDLSLLDAVAEARESLDSKRALRAFKRFMNN
jgi:anthranilate phosphoribosyltransferase